MIGRSSSLGGTAVCVFGATGPLGKILIQRLANRGAKIIIPYRCDDANLGPLKIMGDLGKLFFKRFDIKDDNLFPLIEGADVVINLCSTDRDGWNYSMDDVNIKFPRKLSSIIGKDKRFIHLSCLDVLNYDKEGVDPFLKSKYIAEMAIINERPNSVIIRSSRIFGRDDKFINSLALRPLSSTSLVSPLHVNNCSEGIIRIALEDYPPLYKRLYNPLLWELEGPERFSLSQIQKMVNDAIMNDDDGDGARTRKSKFSIYDEPRASDKNGLFCDIGISCGDLKTIKEGLLEIIRPFRSKENWNKPLKI